MSVRRMQQRLPSVVFVALCLIWGSSWLAIKVGLNFLPPFLFAGIRFAVASVFLLFLVPLLHAPIPRDRFSWEIMLLLGIFQVTLAYGLVFWGEQYISSGLTAVLSATFPFFVLIFAPVLIRTESITRRKIIGIFGAFVGVAIIFWHSLIPGQGSLVQLSLPGSLAIVGSAASSGLGTVIAKKYSSRIAPATNVMIQSIVGSVTLSFVGVVTEGGAAFEFSPTAIAAVLYLGVIASALAFVGWYWLFTKTTATNSSLILLITPVIALLLGWLILREELEPVVALGTVLILSGVYVTVEQDDETRP
jgi:drug/metabolite transporter (DMT)-like permease